MTTIERNTFFRCSSLTAVEGMNVIQSIGQGAFNYCSSLETIDVNQRVLFFEGPSGLGDVAFYKCNARINRIN
jgi:hypothetical protein